MIPQPDIRAIKERGDIYVLQSDYECLGFTVPAGFEYDGASVPRAVWTTSGMTPDGYYRPAALVHDWLYSQGGHAVRYGQPFNYTRKIADGIFRDILRELRLIRWHTFVLFIGVRMFGWLSWGK